MSRERDGHRVSGALSEARTIHSRAKTALGFRRTMMADPAGPEIVAILEEIVAKLEPYKKIGRTMERTR